MPSSPTSPSDPNAAEPKFTGRIRRGSGVDELTGFLVESWSGWQIKLVGKRDPAGGGFLLQGFLEEAPEWLRVPGVDAPES